MDDLIPLAPGYTSVRSAFGNLLHDESPMPYAKDGNSIVSINLDREYRIRFERISAAFEIEGTRVCDVARGFINKAPNMHALLAMLALLED